LIAVLSLFTLAWAQTAERATTPGESDSSPEIERLVKTLGGEWRVVETFEHSEFFPNGGARRGTARISLGTGGTTLIEDYHSGGPAGRLDFIAVIWWDKDAKLYRFFTWANNIEGPKCHRTAGLPVPLYVYCTVIPSKINLAFCSDSWVGLRATAISRVSRCYVLIIGWVLPLEPRRS
jgi:hypothetical protein